MVSGGSVSSGSVGASVTSGSVVSGTVGSVGGSVGTVVSVGMVASVGASVAAEDAGAPQPVNITTANINAIKRVNFIKTLPYKAENYNLSLSTAHYITSCEICQIVYKSFIFPALSGAEKHGIVVLTKKY
jgi:hypothetical protein